MPSTKPLPRPGSSPDAVAVAQQRDAPNGIERGRRPSDRMRLPHERDESPLQGADRSRMRAGTTDVIEQAARDIARGLVDTERRGTPSDVPGPKRRWKKSGGRT
jgi:hypothetical protein